MAEKRISFLISWDWPNGERSEIVASLSLHEAGEVDETLQELLGDEGFDNISIEAASGEEPVAIGIEELYSDILATRLEDEDFEDLAEKIRLIAA